LKDHRLSLERIETAARSIDPVFLNSPQFESEPLSDELGMRLILKVETVNPIRSFKGRGADFWFRIFQRIRQRWFAHRRGNFRTRVAYAARKRGLPAVHLRVRVGQCV